MQPVADGVYVYTESDGSQDPATVSSLVVVTEEGVLVGDGLGHVGDPHESDVKAQKLIDEIRRLTDQPIKYLINCSWHPDHTNGNHLFRDAGALIVGHRKARQGLLQYYERATDIPKTPPMVTYEDSFTDFLGDKKVRVSFLGRAHTEGDSVIYPPEQRRNHAAFSARDVCLADQRVPQPPDCRRPHIDGASRRARRPGVSRVVWLDRASPHFSPVVCCSAGYIHHYCVALGRAASPTLRDDNW